MIVLTNERPDCIELEELDEDGTLLGRAVLEPDGREAWLGLEIVPEARGRHLGRHLLARSLEVARSHDVATVRVAFLRGDPAALGLVRTCDHPARVHAAGASSVAEIATFTHAGEPDGGEPDATVDLH